MSNRDSYDEPSFGGSPPQAVPFPPVTSSYPPPSQNPFSVSLSPSRSAKSTGHQSTVESNTDSAQHRTASENYGSSAFGAGLDLGAVMGSEESSNAVWGGVGGRPRWDQQSSRVSSSSEYSTKERTEAVTSSGYKPALSGLDEGGIEPSSSEPLGLDDQASSSRGDLSFAPPAILHPPSPSNDDATASTTPTNPSRYTSSPVMPHFPSSTSTSPKIILALLVVDFNHLQGPVIDYVWPTGAISTSHLQISGPVEGSRAVPASTGFSSPAVFSDRDENGRRRDGRGERGRNGMGSGGGSKSGSAESPIERALRRDEELARRLPFLALPDGAHLSEEDYSYFHCIYDPSTPSDGDEEEDDPGDIPRRQTLFGISCNRQIAASDLLYRPPDVTRSTVQKAVVVLASRPVFFRFIKGPIRDKLGVVTRAFFAQRDFTKTEILPQFYTSLEKGLEGKADEGGMFMGTSLRELLHTFRHKTLTLVKLMMLQKRSLGGSFTLQIMFYGYPVEILCTYQYSLISLMPGLLLNLADAADPSLDFRTGPAKRPSSLRTSDRNSLLRYMGLPLHTFGKDAFFQPYLPLQQIDMLKAKSWLVGTTNSIVTQQKDCQWDLLINIQETNFDFHDPKLERLVALTSSDRLWMDQVVKSVEETWNPADPTRPIGLVYRGSDDDLRSRFEEYVCAALATLKYQDFLSSGQTGIPAMPGELRVNVAEPFSVKWLETFKLTTAYGMWNATTDELLFDICEPKHPCEGKTNAVSDIGIRLAEGIHDLRLDKQFDSGKEVLGTAAMAASSTLFKAFDGVRTEVVQRMAKPAGTNQSTGLGISSGGRPVSAPINNATARDLNNGYTPSPSPPMPIAGNSMQDVKATLGGWGSFLGSKVASLSQAAQAATARTGGGTTPSPSSPVTSVKGGGGLRELNLVNAKGSVTSPPLEKRNRDTF